MLNIDTLPRAMEAGAKEYLSLLTHRTLVGAASRLFSLRNPVRDQIRVEKVIQYLSQAHSAQEKTLVAYAILSNDHDLTLRSYLIDAIENSTAITNNSAYQAAWGKELLPTKHPVDYTSPHALLVNEDAPLAKVVVLTRWLNHQVPIDPQHVNNIVADLEDESRQADLSLLRSSPSPHQV